MQFTIITIPPGSLKERPEHDLGGSLSWKLALTWIM
jgi:hypothetical protein